MAEDASKPLVSVIIPVLNELHLARRAVESVLLERTYPNVEVIVVPAKGIDTSELDPVDKHWRVKVTYDDENGSGPARNIGMQAARGEYIAFLDHDDWFLPTKIERQVAIMLKHRSLISHTSYYAVFPRLRPDQAVVGSGKMSGRVFPGIMTNCRIALPTVMMHRSLPESGFRFPETGHLGAELSVDRHRTQP